MTLSRKAFLHVTGLSLLIAAGKKAVASLTGAGQSASASPAIRWGVAIDLAKCARLDGCTKCIAACHEAHNVPAMPERRHEVRWIWKEPFERVFRDQEVEYTSIADLPVMVFCNHCDNPPCVRVCPTQATWRRDDGIVAMDWHRCIGCRYCIAACPYGARSFNWKDPRPFIKKVVEEFPTRTKGVVEKCNFCQDRLARGIGPACVLACKQLGVDAMVFGDLSNPDSEVARILRARFTIRRKPALGTSPHVFYVV